MKKHILLIIDGLPGGGAENVTLTLAKGFQQRGCAVTLLSLSARLDYEIPTGVNYIVDHDTNNGPFRKTHELSRRAASMDRLLPNLFAELGKPALVISHLHKTDRIVVRSRVLKECNVWYCIHGMFSRTYLGNKTGFSRWLKQKKVQKVYRNRKVITVSEAIGADLIEQTGIRPEKLITIYNPFNIKEIENRAAQKNLFADEDYILHVGRFHQVKRHDRLLAAFALADLPAKLVLIGQGEAAVTHAIQEKLRPLTCRKKSCSRGSTPIRCRRSKAPKWSRSALTAKVCQPS